MRRERWVKIAVSLVLTAWILVLAGVIPSLSSERAAMASQAVSTVRGKQGSRLGAWRPNPRSDEPARRRLGDSRTGGL